MLALALVSGSTCEACIDPLNLIVHDVGKYHTPRKRWDCVPRGNQLHFFMKAKSRTSKPASHQPIAASKLHVPMARLLRPLVRLCICSGMTFPALAQLLRELFVNVAEHDFALEGKEQTDSRVSLLTGIHRKEVARLRGAGTPVNETPATLSLTSAIIARWLAAPEFTDAKGDPLPRTCGLARFWMNGWIASSSLSMTMTRSCWWRLPSFRAETTIASGIISAAICMITSRRRRRTFLQRRRPSWSARYTTTACRPHWRSGLKRVRANSRWRR